VFKNLHQSPLFISIVIFTVAAQYGIVEYGGGFVRTVSLSSDQWLKCFLLSSLTLPIGGLMRLVPVRDNESDYAEISKLIASTTTTTKDELKSINSTQQFDLSFLVWLLVVSIIPVLVLQHFNDQWQLL